MYRIGKTESIEHTFFVWEKWVNIQITLGVKLTVNNVIETIIQSEGNWFIRRRRRERGSYRERKENVWVGVSE